MHVGDHELEARPDLDEEFRSLGVSLGRWRALPVLVAIILVAAPVSVQHHAIRRGEDLDVPACGLRRGGLIKGWRYENPAQHASLAYVQFERRLAARLISFHLATTDLKATAVVGLAVHVVQALAAYKRGVEGLINRQAH